LQFSVDQPPVAIAAMKRPRMARRADIRKDFDEPFQRHGHERQSAFLRRCEVPDEVRRDVLCGGVEGGSDEELQALVIQSGFDHRMGKAHLPEKLLCRICPKVGIRRVDEEAGAGRDLVITAGEGLAAAFDDVLLRAGGFDLAMEILAEVIERDRPGEGADRDCDMVIAGISESRGPLVYRWSTRDSDAGPAYVLQTSRFGFACDVELTAGQHAGIVGKGGLKACGVPLMEYFRTLKVPGLNGGGRPDYFVGGHVDFTCLSPDGITGERLHTWDEDKVGERLDPFKIPANVVPLPAHTRQQRRALERQRRKLPA